mgnify:CR=1 FL=1
MSSVNLFTSSTLRLSGMASGMDTEQIISNLMKIERLPLDRLYQKKQLAEWKRDQYRDVINLIRSLKDEYFDVLKPANYMLSSSAYKKFSAVSSDSSVVTASASANAAAGTYEIVVKQLATAAEARSANPVSGQIQGETSISKVDLNNFIGKKIVVTLDGVTRTITIGNFNDRPERQEGSEIEKLVWKLQDELQANLDDAFGEGKINVEIKDIISSGEDGEIITFKTEFQTSNGATKLTLNSAASEDGLSLLGISNGASNRLNTSESLGSLVSRVLGENAQIFDDDGNLKFSINSQEFTFSKSTSISSMLSTINSNADAKVNIRYDELTGNFVLTAKQLGAGSTLEIKDSESGFLKKVLGIDIEGVVPGKDAEVEIGMVGEKEKTLVTRSSNSFTVNGITYNLQKADLNTTITIKVETDVDGIYETITGFVNKYNEMIEKINSKLSEKYDSNYLPLTDEQKEAMKEKDIELWEQKAKTGLLRNDSILEKMISDLRRALYDSIEGVGIHLTSIGITTGSYEQKGKLIVDEQKLKEAIRNNPDGVMELFSKKSEKYSYSRTMSSEERAIWYKESGLAQRIYGIIEDNISTFRDKDGRKGLLLEKAGIQGDASEYSNLIYKEIKEYESSISKLYEKLVQKENNYFRKFAAMEEALNSMYSQSNWLYAQLSSMTGR